MTLWGLPRIDLSPISSAKAPVWSTQIIVSYAYFLSFSFYFFPWVFQMLKTATKWKKLTTWLSWARVPIAPELITYLGTPPHNLAFKIALCWNILRHTEVFLFYLFFFLSIFAPFSLNSVVIKLSLLRHLGLAYLPAPQDTRVQSLGPKDPLEKETATHSNILAWEIPCTDEPGRLQLMGSQRVGHVLKEHTLAFRNNGSYLGQWVTIWCVLRHSNTVKKNDIGFGSCDL